MVNYLRDFDFQNTINDIPSKYLRNKIVHDYEGIKLTFIWDIISNDLPELKEKLERIINDEKI